MTPLRKARAQDHPIQHVQSGTGQQVATALELVEALAAISAATDEALTAATRTALACGAKADDVEAAKNAGTSRFDS